MATHGRDRGDTLVEILAAVSILSIGVIALITALATITKATGANRNQAQALTTLLAAAEYVKTMNLAATDYASCGPTPAALSATQFTAASGFTARYLQGSPVPVPSGQTATLCTSVLEIPVQVQGAGFSMQLMVVRRPS